MSASNPKLSVVMSVYNGQDYLKQAIESVLGQTFADFEFIIIDDGSTDTSQTIIKESKDPRIRLLTQENHGLVNSLNRGVQEAKADYIARMDADDISHPTRFEEQMKLIAADPKLALVGSAFEMIDEQGNIITTFITPPADIDIKRHLFIHNPFGHGTMIMSKAAVIEAGGYDDSVGPVEDYALWVKLYELGYTFASVPLALYSWRNNPAGVSWAKTEAQREAANKLQANLWDKYLLPESSLGQLISRLWQYRGLQSPLAGQIATQHADDQYLLALRALRQGYIGLGLTQKLAFILLLPNSLYALGGRAAKQLLGLFNQAKHQAGSLLRRAGLRH